MSNAESLAPDTIPTGNLPIKPRKMAFGLENIERQYFFNDNLLLSAWVSALSASFPPGESEFIASVRNYRDQITDPQQLEDIRGFIGQEGHHSHQHKQLNESLTNLGFDVVRLEKYFEGVVSRQLKNSSDKRRLAITSGMEHLTAIMSDYVLQNQNQFNNVDSHFIDLFNWHAVEEIEHKAVAFDVYMATEGDEAYLRRMLIVATLIFFRHIIVGFVRLLWWNKKLPSWKDIRGFWRFLGGKHGMMRWISRPYKDYLKKGFHPWDHQNQALVDEWKNNLSHGQHG
ncbi:Uncharacterised protein [BD1-7 clade bacterium]|uniref:Metal-dependent hydrolase n=1 Tax=BD1-7 clade bacterium TaxID=2029982 RepID=A0A5S9P791_9GAMM|nr:Uncharacterised protein [BD1-7 clade bacterium]CAA0099381.1 Uncharacterised protein [BD1-7 clade bacterium]